jgi:hypothetical protein
MRRLLTGIVLGVLISGGGMALAQDQPKENADTGGAPGNCATPFASPGVMASPDVPELAIASTPAVDLATPGASAVASLDCGTPDAGTPAS